MITKYDSRQDTLNHIEQVRDRLRIIVSHLHKRIQDHDLSKLHPPEKEVFDEYTPKLRDSTYGSDEYEQFRREMGKALEHHYFNNSHHPEYYGYMECNGCFSQYSRDYNQPCPVCGYTQMTLRPNVSGMDLLDIVEMLCDWKAATLRHADGDLRKSIEINQKRFGYTDELKAILTNTAAHLGFFED